MANLVTNKYKDISGHANTYTHIYEKEKRILLLSVFYFSRLVVMAMPCLHPISVYSKSCTNRQHSSCTGRTHIYNGLVQSVCTQSVKSWQGQFVSVFSDRNDLIQKIQGMSCTFERTQRLVERVCTCVHGSGFYTLVAFAIQQKILYVHYKVVCVLDGDEALVMNSYNAKQITWHYNYHYRPFTFERNENESNKKPRMTYGPSEKV